MCIFFVCMLCIFALPGWRHACRLKIKRVSHFGLLRVQFHVIFIGHDATINTGCTYKVISYGVGIWTRVRWLQSNRSTIWAIIHWQKIDQLVYLQMKEKLLQSFRKRGGGTSAAKWSKAQNTESRRRFKSRWRQKYCFLRQFWSQQVNGIAG